MTALPLLLLLLLISSSSIFLSEAQQLSVDYYNKACPQFENIIRETVQEKQIAQVTTAAGTLRLFFHDCFVHGCDASVLLTSDHTNLAERDSDINLALPGDAFDVVIRAKTRLELACPGVVSCSDIIAQATRDLVTMVGGPIYNVQLGRKDGLVSKAEMVQSNIPVTNMTMDEIVNIFAKKGFNVQEMVALTGGRTIGFSHCKEFANRIFNFSSTSQSDPEMNPTLATRLRELCANHLQDNSVAAFNDVTSPGAFDNKWFKALLKGYGILGSDHALIKDARTRPFVQLYASNQTAFFNDFSRAMEKMSLIEVKVGNEGEVRHRCDKFNAGPN